NTSAGGNPRASALLGWLRMRRRQRCRWSRPPTPDHCVNAVRTGAERNDVKHPAHDGDVFEENRVLRVSSSTIHRPISMEHHSERQCVKEECKSDETRERRSPVYPNSGPAITKVRVASPNGPRGRNAMRRKGRCTVYARCLS